MDVNIRLACLKAIDLCNYMLKSTDDEFVRDQKHQIELLIVDNRNSNLASAKARGVSRYIKHNFDTVVGENTSIDIDTLLDSAP